MIPADAQSVVGGFWRLSRAQRAVVSALAVVLVPTCLGLTYLLSDFWFVNKAKDKEFVSASARDTLILSGYDQAMKVFFLAQAVHAVPAMRDSLRPAFREAVRSLHAIGTQYINLLSNIQPEERAVLLESFNHLWPSFDDLVARSQDVFSDAAWSRPLSTPSVKTGLSYIENPNAYFAAMRNQLEETLRAELAEDLRLVTRLRAEMEINTYRGFVVAFLLIGVGSALAIVIVRRSRLSEERKRRYETLLESSINPVELVDVNGTILYVNPAFEQAIGRSAGDLVGRFVFEAVQVVNQQARGREMWSSVAQQLTAGNAWTGEVEIRSGEREPHVTLLIISPVVNSDGRVTEAIGIHHDVTERRELARKFAESQEKYQNIVESSLDGIAIIQDGKLVFVNASSAKIFGYGVPDEMRNVSFIDTVAPSNRFLVLEGYEGKTIGDDMLRNFEMKGLTKQGNIIDLEVNAKLVAWNGKPAVQASFRDITKRKALEREQALWLWEQETMSTIDRQLVSSVNLQSVLDAISYHAKALTRADWAGVMMLDLESNLARWRAVTGNRVPVPPDPIPLEKSYLALTRSKEHVVLKNIGDPPSAEFLPFAGEDIHSAVRVPLILDREVRGQLVVAYRRNHDFTPREIRLLTSLAEKSSIALANAQLYDNLLSRERELELLSGARVMAQEEERRRIAREIHDSLGQMLTAIKFNVEILEDATDLQSEEDRRRVADIKLLLDTAMAEAREISYNLMPSVLVDFGLVPALQFLGEQFKKRNELNVQVHTRGVERRLDSAIEIGLYRIAQEALNNIAKHAEAHEVTVQLIGDSQAIRLIIDDDGKGFQVNRFEPRTDLRRGMGLVSMRERAASFNGVLVLDSRPGRGTEIIVEIPRVVQTTNG